MLWKKSQNQIERNSQDDHQCPKFEFSPHLEFAKFTTTDGGEKQQEKIFCMGT